MNTKILLLAIILFFLTSSCNKGVEKEKFSKTEKFVPAKSVSKTQTSTEKKPPKVSEAELWLRGIFKCENSKGFCLPDEEKVCTKRFYEFLGDSEEIYGASNLTDEERVQEEKNYLKKYENIYPPNREANWLFGRGNGGEEHLENVEITPISDLKFKVFVDFGEGIKTQSETQLVKIQDSYKIDFCKTEFIKY